MNPLFSIIIPTFNRAEKLRRALESVEKQTFKDFEVIVCDDGSMDNTKSVVNSFAVRMKVTYLWEKNWGGPARPRNNGLKIAQGEWVCFLDADDWWYPNKLETIVPYLDDADIIYHEIDMAPRNWLLSSLLRSRQVKSPVFVDLMVKANAIKTSGVAARKQILMAAGGFTEEKSLIAVEDFDLWLKAARITERFLFIPRSLGVYQQGEDSISEASARQIERYQAVFRKHMQFLNDADRKEATLMQQYMVARIKQRMGLYQEALELYHQSLEMKNPRYRLQSRVMIYLIRFAAILPHQWLKI